MPMPLRVIERLFDRLMATYGSEFSRRYEGVTPEAVKAAWAEELQSFETNLDAIAWALQHLPERCPNAIEFRALARAAPAPAAPPIEPPRPADPERVKAEFAKMAESRTECAHGPKDWARRIVDAHAGGARVTPCSLRFARQALGLEGV